METPVRKKFKLSKDVKQERLSREIKPDSLQSLQTPPSFTVLNRPKTELKRASKRFVVSGNEDSRQYNSQHSSGVPLVNVHFKNPVTAFKSQFKPDHDLQAAGPPQQPKFVSAVKNKDLQVWSPSPRKKVSYYDVTGVSNYVQMLVVDEEVNLEMAAEVHKAASPNSDCVVLDARRWNRFCYYMNILHGQQKKQILLLDILRKAPTTFVGSRLRLGPIYCEIPTPVYREWELIAKESEERLEEKAE